MIIDKRSLFLLLVILIFFAELFIIQPLRVSLRELHHIRHMRMRSLLTHHTRFVITKWIILQTLFSINDITTSSRSICSTVIDEHCRVIIVIHQAYILLEYFLENRIGFSHSCQRIKVFSYFELFFKEVVHRSRVVVDIISHVLTHHGSVETGDFLGFGKG